MSKTYTCDKQIISIEKNVNTYWARSFMDMSPVRVEVLNPDMASVSSHTSVSVRNIAGRNL